MKYIVGASIGGLFGLGMPLMMEVKDINDEVPRIEVPQQPEELQPMAPSQGTLHLPDNICRYLELEAESPKEQAKECLNIGMYAIPAI